jgi:hypothetical protein
VFLCRYKNINRPAWNSAARNETLANAINEIKQHIDQTYSDYTASAKQEKLKEIVNLTPGHSYSQHEYWSPLHYACWWHDAKMSEQLLAIGVNANEIGPYSYTPLHWATGTPDQLRQIIPLTTNINAVSHIRETALHHAAQFPPVAESVSLLVAAGVDIKARTTDGYTALALTIVDPAAPQPTIYPNILKMSLDCLVTLCKLGAVAHETPGPTSALEKAIGVGNLKAIVILLSFGMQVRIAHAGRCKDVETSNLLVLNGAKPLIPFGETIRKRNKLYEEYGAPTTRFPLIHAMLSLFITHEPLIPIVLSYSTYPIFDLDLVADPEF